MFELINIFDTFLPQLLLYPNPSDPLNGVAASLMMRDPDGYNKQVRNLVKKYAVKEEALEEISDISREDLSELSDTSELDPEFL